MKTLINTIVLLLLLAGFVRLVDHFWYVWRYNTTKLAMARSDDYHVTIRGKCYTL